MTTTDPDSLLHIWHNLVLPKLKVTSDGCWEFTGRRRQEGYGAISVGRKQLLTHRVAAAVHLGLDIVNPTTLVCHHCDNPPCCNADHLFLGSRQDNIADAAAKGRVCSGQSRKTHCPLGHPYEGRNLIVSAIPARNGRPEHIARRCRECWNASKRRRAARTRKVKISG